MTVLEIIITIFASLMMLPIAIFLLMLIRAFFVEFGFLDSLCLKDMWVSYGNLIQKYDDNNDITPFGRIIIKGLTAVVLFPFVLAIYLMFLVVNIIFLAFLPLILLFELMFVNKKYHFIGEYRRHRQMDKEYEDSQKED